MPQNIKFLAFVCVLSIFSAERLPAFQNSQRTSINSVAPPQIGLFLTSSTGGVQGSIDLRAIVGAPGAAVVSGSIALPAGIKQVWLAPRQSYALAEDVNGAISILNVPGFVASTQPIPSAMARPDFVVFSPAAQSLALYSSDTCRVQILTGLPLSPHLSADYVSNIVSPIHLLTVSDDGSELLAAGNDNSIYLLAASGRANLLYAGGSIADLTFLPRTRDAAFVDANDGLVAILRSVGVSATPVVVASGLTSLQGKLSLASTDSAQTLILGMPAAKQILTINLTSLQMERTPNPNGATMLIPLQHSNNFLLSAPSDQPAWIFEYVPEKPRIYFAAHVDGARP